MISKSSFLTNLESEQRSSVDVNFPKHLANDFENEIRRQQSLLARTFHPSDQPVDQKGFQTDGLRAERLWRVAASSGSKPPKKPTVIIGPDGKLIFPQKGPQNLKPSEEVPEPILPSPRKPDLQLACTLRFERCLDKCDDIRGRGRIAIIAKVACKAYCAAEYVFCRFSSSLSEGGL